MGASGWPRGLLEGDPLQELPGAGLTRCGQACLLPRQAPWGRAGSSAELVPGVGARPAVCTPVRDWRPAAASSFPASRLLFSRRFVAEVLQALSRCPSVNHGLFLRHFLYPSHTMSIISLL